jgi:glycosyltransferase involved in cell wall biosynthesis
MRVIQVVPRISEEASGPSYSVPRLCESLIAADADVTLVALGDSAGCAELPFLKTFPIGGIGPHRLGISPRMHEWLRDQVASGLVEILHNHSLWMMPNVYAGRVSQRGRPPLMVSPRGTLSAWALQRSRLRKKFFWHWFQEAAVRAAACFHATAPSEAEDIRRLGFRQPICIIPNGIDVPALAPKSPDPRRQLLFLGRLHPKKGVDILLRAWKVVARRFPDWELRIAGPDQDGHAAAMRALAAQLQLDRVVFVGPLYGAQKLDAYRQASLFVLPTHSENFGLTVGEALAAGTPVIVTRGAPWQQLSDHGAGWWIEIGLEPLIACLEQALWTPPQEIEEMGRAGHEWMRRDFSWERIAGEFLASYRWLIDGGEPPPCANLD